MAEIQNNKPILHRKEWQTMMPAIMSPVAGSFVIADDSSEQNYALFVYNNTAHYLYSHEEDSWLQIPSGALATTIAAGACGTYLPWSTTYTANGGSASTITVAAASHNVNGFARGKEVEILTGATGNPGCRRKITSILTNAGTGTITLTLDNDLPAAVVTSNTFRIKSGSFFVLMSGTLASGCFKRLDLATMTWSTLSVTGLPSSWGTDGRMVSPYVGNVYYDEGAVASATTTSLGVSGRSWTTNQWTNYQVRIIEGTGKGQTKTITANTGTQLSFGAMTISPDATSRFAIEGDENAIYLLGNAAVTMYKYSISGNSWSTLTPTVARPAAPSTGMGANFVGRTGDAGWSNVSDIKDGRYIYCVRGGGTAYIDRYDIATNTWLPSNGVTYFNTLIGFNTGASAFWNGRFLFVATAGSTTAPQQFLKYDVVDNILIPLTADWYFGGTAYVGNKIWVKNLSAEGKVKWLYCLQSNSVNLRRIMLF